MIQNNQYINHSEHIGEIQENRVGIDVKNIDFVTSLLTSNLYSNPVESFLRESVSNAYDSHVEAGVEVPILLLIDVINDNECKLTIRDYGTGLSPERFDEIYKFIGSSTKRESNDYIGSFGLGRFAGLSCATAMSLTSYHNNVRYDYIMYKNEKGINIDKLNEVQGEYKNGLEVSVTVNTTPNILKESILKLCYFKDLYIEIHGIENTESYCISYDYYKLAEDIKDFNKRIIFEFDNLSYCDFLLKSNMRITRLSLRVGNVLYSNEDTILYSVGFTVKLPIGSVDITPSREALQYTDYTKASITEYAEKAREEFATFVLNNIKTDYTFKEFYLQFIEHRNIQISYKGTTLSIWNEDVSIDNLDFTCDNEPIPNNYAKFLKIHRYDTIDKNFIYKKQGCKGDLSFKSLFFGYDIFEKCDNITKASTLDYFTSSSSKFIILQQGGIQRLKNSWIGTSDQDYKEFVEFTFRHIDIKKLSNADVPESYLKTYKAANTKEKTLQNNDTVRRYGPYQYQNYSLRYFKDKKGFIVYTQNSNEEHSYFTRLCDSFKHPLFHLITVKKNQLPLFENRRRFISLFDFLYKRNKFLEKLTTAYLINQSYKNIEGVYWIPLFKEFDNKYFDYINTVRCSSYKEIFKTVIDNYVKNKWYNELDVTYYSFTKEDAEILKLQRDIEDNQKKIIEYEIFKKCGKNSKLGIKYVTKPKCL